MPPTKVEQLFPRCSPGNCPITGCKATTDHHHILPMQQALLDSTERYVALVGGYGSAKTLAACVMGHLLSVGVNGNMGIVLRKSLPKLHDSTERIYLEVLNRSGVPYQQREMRDGWPGRIIYGNGSEVVFRETKDPARFLGPEYGWFFIDEAQEEAVKLFNDLTGRLRLIRAANYLKGIIGTNPPSQQHWIATKFPKPGSWTEKMTVRGEIIEISYCMIRSSTYDNPFLNPEYVASLMQTHTASEVKRIVEGHYGFVLDGDPVYPKFDFVKHVGAMDPPPRLMSLYRVWDFGFHSPAVIWGQIFRCKEGGLHMIVLHELMRQSIEAAALAPLVLEETAKMFPNIPPQMVLDGGDAFGAAMSDKGPGPIITLSRPYAEGGYNLRFRYRKFSDIDPGLDLVRQLIRTKCKCGYYLLTVHRRCQELIQALSGGYHFPKERPGVEKKRKPVKDGFYDNLADCLRYLAELFYRPAMMGNMNEAEGVVIPAASDHPFAWMGL